MAKGMMNISLSEREDGYVRQKAVDWDMSINAVIRKMVRLGSVIEEKIAKGQAIAYKNEQGEWIQIIPLDFGPMCKPMPVTEASE